MDDHFGTSAGACRPAGVPGLLTSSWSRPEIILEVVHPKHSGHVGGFVVDSPWLSEFWLSLAKENKGVKSKFTPILVPHFIPLSMMNFQS